MRRSQLGMLFAFVASWGEQRPSAPSRIEVTLGEVEFRAGAGTTIPVEPFGSIESARFIGHDVVVVDGRRPGLFHFTLRTRKVEVFGRAGSGPGEMHEPTVLQVSDGRWATLLDRALVRLTHYEYASGKLRMSATTRLEDDGTQSFCTLKGRTIAYGYSVSSGRILHDLNEGKRGRGWGEPLFAGGPRINDIATGGTVLCLERRGMMVVAPHLKGEVLAYSESGALKWRTALRDFVGPVIQEVSGGGVLFGRQPGSNVTHGTIAIHQLTDDLLLLQTGVRSREHPGRDFDYNRVDTRLLRISDGVEISKVSDLPIILDIGKDRAVVAGGDPDLWIEVRTFRVVFAAP